MEANVFAGAEGAGEPCQWGDPAPAGIAQEEMDLIAFALLRGTAGAGGDAEEPVNIQTEPALRRGSGA